MTLYENALEAEHNQGGNTQHDILHEDCITELLDDGIPVFPCRPNKSPYTPNGFKDASTDAHQIDRWSKQYPNALVGVATGHVSKLLVVDIDPDGKGWYVSNYERLVAGRVNKTPRGHHLIYRMPADDIRCSASKLAPGVDVRANGGYIIWWPQTNLGVVGDMDDIADPPPWLLAALTAKAKTTGPGIPDGQRNSELMSRGGRLRRQGATREEIEAKLLSLNDRVCSPPLSAEEVRKIAVSASRYEPASNTITLTDFLAHMPDHRYIFIPTRDLWPAASVDSSIEWPDGEDGNKMKPSRWLDANRSVEQMTWAPGLPLLIENKLIDTGGWLDHYGCTCFNQYRPPTLQHGDAKKAGQWLDHLAKVYPEDIEHITHWLAHRVQHPDQKLNHALVLGGKHGIGKDTILEPVKMAVGPWNCHEVSPGAMLGRFNGFVKSVILRVSEARDLGDVDRFAFYDHTKSLIAAPPDVIRVDEKNVREYPIPNLCGVIITTNHKSDGLYLPADDRRHYVAWSDLSREAFDTDYWNRLWQWYENGGIGHVAAYLSELDLSGFDPKAPPTKTEAFWHIVNAARPPEESELADILDKLRWPDATTLADLVSRARVEHPDFADWLSDRRNRRQIPHRLESAGYENVRNPHAKEGQWAINGKRQNVYAKTSLSINEKHAAANKLSQCSR